MAASEAQNELISSLSQDEIPIKLRCATCSRLAVNAFRLPCCEQAICETCQSTLPSSCPVCEHTPVAAEDCKPNKSLRTTIKVFLRTEEKKREALRLKEVKESPRPISLDAAAFATPVEAPAQADAVDAKAVDTAEPKAELSPIQAVGQVDETPVKSSEIPDKAEQDILQPSIEEITPGQEPTEESVETGANEIDDNMAEKDNASGLVKDANGESISGQGITQAADAGAGFGFGSNAGGAFPAMGFGGDFNQMQMMMAMQNGAMGPNAFGNFPMMGMPGMGMDPMAMQSMFMNGGFGAGMNGMNMNMGVGMGGFDGGVGAGFNNEWNGQQSWNVGPDNFNHPNAAGMGTGDYGSNNSGYNPHASRYNQGNYGHGNQYNNYSSYGYQSRGRGRGRGGYGGGYGHGSNEPFSQQFPQQFGSGAGVNGTSSETGQIPTGPKADAAPGTPSNVDEFGREIRQMSEAQDGASAKPASKDDSGAAATVQGIEGSNVDQDAPSKDTSNQGADQAPRPIQTLDEVQGYARNGFNGTYNPGPSRGGFGPGFPGRGFNPMQHVKPVDVPINAPTGPKAMRDGLPNTGLSGLRGRVFPVPGVPSLKPNGGVSAPLGPEQSEKDSKQDQKSASPSRVKSKERSRSRSRDRRRSRSRDRHYRRHRHRTASMSEDEKESERRREHRRERRRRREEEGDDREDTGAGEKHADEDGKDLGDEKSRSASPSESRPSSHKSRRDRDKYRDRDRDRDSDREYKSSSRKHRSSNRERSRSRDRDRDREYRHRHSRRGSEDVEGKERPDKSIPPTPIEAEGTGRTSTTTNNTIEIKGSSSRRKSTLDEVVIPTGPRQDRVSSTREREKDSSRGMDSRRHRDDEDPRYRSSRHRESDRERAKERDRVKDKEKESDRPKAPPTAPAVQDPHTVEREARNRERLLKEAQRIAGLTGLAGGKRSREDTDDARKGRKKGRRGDESEEGRIARLEAERESARWG